MSSEKKASPVAYVLLFLGTAVTGAVLSFIYLWINGLKILPIDWLYVLLAVAVGAVMGFVSTKIVKLFKIKSLVPAVAVVVLGCLAFTYFKWALYVATDARNELGGLNEEEKYIYTIWFEILSNEFTNEEGIIYSNLEEIIEDMQNFSAYDYGILDNDFIWWLWGEDPAAFNSREIRYLQGISYYEMMEFDVDFGTSPRIAANEIREIIGSSGFVYIRHYSEHNETPTVIHYATRPAELIDAIIRINGEGRWTWDDNQVTGVLLWLVWFAEFLIICGYAVIAAPKAIIKSLNEPDVPVTYDYSNNQDNSSPVTSDAPSADSGWANDGFGSAAESQQNQTEEFDEQGRPVAQADEFGRIS
ncbi:MAG: hypothetical protein LBC86_11005 [Oscillospiraceae bacterium]|jgi:hypothetical protein|nr:hypothetical protein [Oscillospiraceae bacterium]